MADLVIQKVSLTGLTPAFSAATSTGDTFTNDGKTILTVKNGDVADKTITINSVQKCNFGFDHDLVVTVPTGEEIQIGPFPTLRFNDDAKKVSITYSDVTTVTVAALQY